MFRILTAAALVGLAISPTLAQDLKLLETKGTGTLTGKVTLDGAVPKLVDLTDIMKKHNDAACCLNAKAKAIEKIDSTWIVDPKTKAVQNVVVWVKAPEGTYLPIDEKFTKRKDKVVIDQPHCAFVPRISACNPVYFDGKKYEKTGQILEIKNSAVVPHNVRATGNPKYNDGFNVNVPAGTSITKMLNPQPLPVSLQCDVHTWMSGKLFVFDHPYYAITKADGTYEIKNVPAGAEVQIMAWHEGVGWVLTKQGQTLKIAEGANKLDLKVKAPE